MWTRRAFLSRSGAGLAGLGLPASAVLDLLGSKALAREAAASLRFGALEPLVELMQESTPEALIPALIARLRGGEPLETLVAAAALANARTFGGQDYDGYHAFMALMPSWAMAGRMPAAQRALPVLKVIHRNTARIRACGGRDHEVMAAALPAPDAAQNASALQHAERASDVAGAESAFAAIVQRGSRATLLALQPLVRDGMDVHRVVLAWRSFETLALAGDEHAGALLRQVVRFCVEAERNTSKYCAEAREVVPRLIADYRLDALAAAPAPQRPALDAFVPLADAVFASGSAESAEAMARALAGGLHPDDAGMALSLAANRLLLQDQGLTGNATAAKPLGSVHGASIGVHASDAAHAWRRLARALPECAGPTLVAAAWHTGGQSARLGARPFSYSERAAELRAAAATDPLAAFDAAVRGCDQAGACAAAEVHLAATRGDGAGALIDRMLAFSVAADGALHAEKFFVTATDEYAGAPAELRDRYLVGLARVVASEQVAAAPGVEDARKLLAS